MYRLELSSGNFVKRGAQTPLRSYLTYRLCLGDHRFSGFGYAVFATLAPVVGAIMLH